MQPDNSFVYALSEWSKVFMKFSVHNLLHYSKENGLSMSQIGALFRVFHSGNCAVSDISGEVGITIAAASQMLDRLLQQGLILRSEDPTDRRMKQIVLTEKGRQALQEIISARQSWFENLDSSLSECERKQIVDALKILVEKANQIEFDPA
jgi:DNA-binding MarR family transcriptional regulator